MVHSIAVFAQSLCWLPLQFPRSVTFRQHQKTFAEELAKLKLLLASAAVVARALAVDAPKEMRFQYSAEIGAALAAPNL